MQVNANLKNLSSLFFVEFVSRILGFIAVTYLARILGTDGFGIINIGSAILSYSLVIAASGLTLLGTKKIAAGKEDPALITGNIILTRILLSILVLVFSVIICYYFIRSREIFLVSLTYLIYLFPSALLLEWFFHGYQKMGIISAGRTLGVISYLLALLLLVHDSEDTVLTAASWVAGGAVNAVFLIILFKKNHYHYNFELNSFRFLKILKESFSLSAASIITQVVILFPVLYLGFVLSASSSGIYSAAYKLIILLLVLDRVFNALFFPKIVHYFKNRPENLEYLLKTILKIISTFGLSVVLLSAVFAESIITLVFSKAFSGSTLIFIILTGSFYFTLINSIFTYTLIAMDKEKVYVLSLIYGSVIFFISIIILTKYFGLPGTAFSYVLFELTSFMVMSLILKKDIRINLTKLVYIPALAALLFVLLTFLKAGLTIQIIAVIIAAIPLVFYLTGFGKEELMFIKRVFI